MPIALITTPPSNPAGLPPAGPDNHRGGDSGFAELLNRQTAAGENGAPADAADEAADTPESGATKETRSERGRPAQRPAPARPATRPATATPAEATDAASRAEGAAKGDDPDTAPLVDPALVNWLAAMHLPTPPAGGAAPVGTTEALDGKAAGQGHAAVQPALEAAPGHAPTTGPDTTNRPDPRQAAGRDDRGAPDLRALAGEADRRGSTVEREEPARAAAEQRIAPAPAAASRQTGFEAAAALLTAAPASATTTASPAAVAVMLPLAPDSPEFAQALGVQVSVLARDGVQQAELHLNPAETGPVSVQIVLEGTQARIEFGADAAPTRQAIESSLPELAAALRDAGLTLSGGGVSEHSRGRDSTPADPTEARPGATRRDGPARVEAPVARPWRSARSAGGVDLYA